MLRLYLDSNVFRYVKPNHPSYNQELHSLMDALDGEILFIYSGAHLDDLKNSVDPYREEDLKLMEKYVKTNYFYRDPIKNITDCTYLTPLEAFKSIDYEAMDQTINNFDIDTLLFKDLDDSDESQTLKRLVNSIFNLPLTSLGPTVDLSKIEGVHKEWFDKIFVDYSPNMTLKELMNTVMPYGASLLSSAKEVTEFRKYVETYFDSNSYNYQQWGMDFNEKLKDKFGKTFLDLVDSMLTGNQKGNIFLRFQKAYNLLEMFNITKETVGGKTKKFNYWSLNNDAAHCYFGSMCDYIVTDDKGVQAKAHIIYSLFDVPTRILSTKDFVEMRRDLLGAEITLDDFIDKLSFNLKNSALVFAKSEIDPRETKWYYELAKPHFNVFPLLEEIAYPSGTRRFVFTLIKNAPELTLLKREVELVSKKIFRVLGEDDEKKGEFTLDETVASGLLRRWMKPPRMFFQLAIEEEHPIFFIKLYVDIHFDQE